MTTFHRDPLIREAAAQLEAALGIVEDLSASIAELAAKIAALTTRRDALNTLVARISQTAGWEPQRGVLVAQVGTLRARVESERRAAPSGIRNVIRAVLDTAEADVDAYRTRGGAPSWDDERVGRMIARDEALASVAPLVRAYDSMGGGSQNRLTEEQLDGMMMWDRDVMLAERHRAVGAWLVRAAVEELREFRMRHAAATAADRDDGRPRSAEAIAEIADHEGDKGNR